ncbi:MAG: aminodeoxychorismate/anthranilate synthase component II [Flavobacteriaceae bacterium]
MTDILLIDNYDSFTYNLVHYLEELGAQVTVRRNNKISLEEVAAFSHIVLSPGPGIPDEAGLLKEIIAAYAPTKKILGVCLGQQAIAEVFGGSLENLSEVYHGIASPIQITDPQSKLFKELPTEVVVGRYHSWVVSKNLPEVLKVTAIDSEGQIMALEHKSYPVYAVQFHPESILTPSGKKMLANWLGVSWEFKPEEKMY